jgi:hypothetical protein
MASASVRVFVAATCLGLVGALCAGPAHTSLITKNLLKNGDAEAAAKGWKIAGSFTAVAYGTAGLPGIQTSQNIGGGNRLFAGGPSTAPASASQLVPIPVAWRKPVASRLAFAQVSASLGGSSTKPDAASVTVAFLDKRGKPLGSFRIGPVTAAQRGNVTALLPVEAIRSIPRACAALRVTIASSGGSGTYDDAYADNVELRLLQ